MRIVSSGPFALRKKRSRKVRELELRSRAFTEALAGRDKLVDYAEKVFGAVRDADAGLGATGLMGLRGQDPRFGLPIDVALAKHGKGGVARSARDRVLAACKGRLARLLGSEGPSEQVRLPLSPYGRAEMLVIPLTAADPFRCRATRSGVVKGRRRGR